MANNGRPERVRRAETDKSVFALEDAVDEIWLQAHKVIQAMKVLPDLKTHRLDFRLGRKRLALFPEKHSLPLPDGAVAEVKWDEGGGYWSLVEIKKAWGKERFSVWVGEDETITVEIEPVNADEEFWLPSLGQFQNGLAGLDEKYLPFGEVVDTEQLGGVFELVLDRKSLAFYSVYAGDAFLDPIHYQLELGRDDPACQQLCGPMVRLLTQVFGKQTEYAV